MRVLHVVRSDTFAGVERHIATLAAVQSRRGHDVTVVGGSGALMKVALGDARVRVVQGDTIRQVIAQVRRHRQVDIIHAHMTAAELGASLGTSKPLIVTRHFAQRRGATPVGRLTSMLIRRRTANQISVSGFVAERIDGSSRVIYSGVEAPPHPGEHSDRVILVAQRLSPEKRTIDALDAFAASGLAHTGWRMDLAGRGSEHDRLVARAFDLGLQQSTSFLGFVSDLSARLGTAGMVLATAPAEPFGLSVVEAMAHGTPVVATSAGGHMESVGRAGLDFLYASGDTAAAGALLKKLAGDSDLRRHYGRELHNVQRAYFTPERQYAETQKIYEEVAGGG